MFNHPQNPVKLMDAATTTKKKEKYFQVIRADVFARYYTLQLIELTRLTHCTYIILDVGGGNVWRSIGEKHSLIYFLPVNKTELETMVKQFKDLDSQSDTLGVNYTLQPVIVNVREY